LNQITHEIKQWNTKYKTISILVLISVGYFCFSFIWNHIEIVVSPSVEHRVFIKGKGTFEINSYARFTIKNEFLPDTATTITKRFGCMPGQLLETRDRSHYCDGRYLDTAKERSIKGADLPVFMFNDVIPNGFAYMSGYHHDSFDSRYWGLLDLSREDIIPLKPIL
jgi:conjugal transfer pilin signal peptidase TrbI